MGKDGRAFGGVLESFQRNEERFFVRICYCNPSGCLRDSFGMKSGASEKVKNHVAEIILSRLIAPFEPTRCPI